MIIFSGNKNKSTIEATKPTKNQAKVDLSAFYANSAKNQTTTPRPVQANKQTSAQAALGTPTGYTTSAVSVQTPRDIPGSTVPSASSPYSDKYYDYNYRPPVGENYVGGYYRKDGTYVSSHYRTNRDDSFWNNYSSRGNLNPHTFKPGTKSPRR